MPMFCTKIRHFATPGFIVIVALITAEFQIAVAQRVLLFEDFESATPDPPFPEECDSGNVGLTADYNDDGMTSAADYTVWRDTLGDTVEPPGDGADGNEDGAITGADYDLWVNAFGSPANLAQACIGAPSVDTFNRSRTIEADPAFATVTGGMFPDPFDPGNNQSLLFRNPNNATQQAVNWFSIFGDDPNASDFYLRDGVIEFDVYLDPVPEGSLRTFFDIRFGWQAMPDDRNQVTTEGDVTIWNNFRMEEDGFQMGNDFLFDQGNASDSYIDTDDLIVEEAALHLRYDIDSDNHTYKLTVENLDDQRGPMEILWTSGTVNQPWQEFFDFSDFTTKPVPGINEISFLTDASAAGVGSTAHADVWLDNLRIVDNDQPAGDPMMGSSLGASVPEPRAWMLLGVGLLGVGVGMRRRAN